MQYNTIHPQWNLTLLSDNKNTLQELVFGIRFLSSPKNNRYLAVTVFEIMFLSNPKNDRYESRNKSLSNRNRSFS